MLGAGLAIKALMHITSDGFLNLLRIDRHGIGYVIDVLPESPPIFRLIQQHGHIEDAEMFRVYNMGIGFCVVVAPADADRVQEIAGRHGRRPLVIGRTIADREQSVWLPSVGLRGTGSVFRATTERPPR
jgi:phosphoribosylformylglycinamidine cyclo-ligase